MEAGGFLGWLGGSGLSQWMRGSLWAYPMVEIVHILGFVLLVGCVFAFDLRVLGFSAAVRSVAIEALGRHLLPWSLAGLVLIVPAGLMMFSAHPHDFIDNTTFQLKLGLIGAAGINALVFHFGVYRGVAGWDIARAAPASARLQAGLSMAIWIGVICCGRLLAYT